MIDGNTAALNKHEAEVEKQEKTYNQMLDDVEPIAKEIHKLFEEMQSIINMYEYDISAETVYDEEFA